MTTTPSTTGPSRLRFRAWHKTYEEMFYVSRLDWNDNDEMRAIHSGSALNYDHQEGGEWTFTPDEVELMQFTGLTDKNGREVFEGDVIQGAGETLYEVRWLNESAQWECFGINTSSVWPLYKLSPVEVLGNIYENPDLLP